MIEPKRPTLTIVEDPGKAEEIKRLEAERAELEQRLRGINDDIAELQGTEREKVAKVIYGLPFGEAPKKAGTIVKGKGAGLIRLFGKSEPDVVNAAQNLSKIKEAESLVDELKLLDVDEIRDRLGDDPVLKRAFLDELERRLMGNIPEPPLPPAAAAMGLQEAA
jgi:hypothetical protein